MTMYVLIGGFDVFFWHLYANDILKKVGKTQPIVSIMSIFVHLSFILDSWFKL